MRGPGLQQGAVHREVITGDVAAQLGLADDRGEEPIRDLVIQQPLPVLGERGGVEGRRVDGQIQEPFEQQVVVESLTKGPLTANRIQGHQHRRFEQLLRRDARSARRRVHDVQLAVELLEHCLDHPADPTDRMIRRDQRLRAQRGQHGQLTFRRTAHHSPPDRNIRSMTNPHHKREHLHQVFQHPARGHSPH